RNERFSRQSNLRSSGPQSMLSRRDSREFRVAAAYGWEHYGAAAGGRASWANMALEDANARLPARVISPFIAPLLPCVFEIDAARMLFDGARRALDVAHHLEDHMTGQERNHSNRAVVALAGYHHSLVLAQAGIARLGHRL